MNSVIFAGAKRPLLVYRKGASTIEEIKGDRMAIGGSKNENRDKEFTNQQISLSKEDIIFLSSDGFSDQNNPERKRFGSQRLNDLIIDNANESMPRIMEVLEKELSSYQQNEEQRDDITFIGLKIK